MLTYLRICGEASVRGKASFHLDIFRAGEDQPVFSPTVLTGDAGQRVKFTVRNQSPASHTFSLDEENIDEVIASGKAATVTVTFPKKGVLFFYCRFHEFLGQGGELKAES
jgi:plastocyanin